MGSITTIEPRHDDSDACIGQHNQISLEQPQCPTGASCPQRKIDQMTVEIACEGMTKTSAGAPTCTTVRSLSLIRDP
jgi:hypothetical protein